MFTRELITLYPSDKYGISIGTQIPWTGWTISTDLPDWKVLESPKCLRKSQGLQIQLHNLSTSFFSTHWQQQCAVLLCLACFLDSQNCTSKSSGFGSNIHSRSDLILSFSQLFYLHHAHLSYIQLVMLTCSNPVPNVMASGDGPWGTD